MVMVGVGIGVCRIGSGVLLTRIVVSGVSSFISAYVLVSVSFSCSSSGLMSGLEAEMLKPIAGVVSDI